MQNVPLGIDHPVVTVRNHPACLERYRAIGFSSSPVSYHPWGTVLSLMMFRDNFIELISVADPSKFGINAVEDFCYGRNVGRFLDRAEGLGLVALHSKDADADHAKLRQAGLPSQGRIDFRRATKKADGTPDTAIVSMGLFLNPEQPDVSQFICHQHRPELIWVPEWQDHPNGANAVAGVTYIAERPADLEERFVAFYGERATFGDDASLVVDTGCGVMRVVSPDAARLRFGSSELPWWENNSPHGISITVSTTRFDSLEGLWSTNGVTFKRGPGGNLFLPPSECGNVILEFTPAKTGT